MKNLLTLIIAAITIFSADVKAAQTRVLEANIVEMSMRTLRYSADRFADVSIIKLNKQFAEQAEGCDKDEVYILANEDKAIISALLAAKLADKPLDFYLDNALPKIDNFCKLVAISIK